MSKLVLKGQEVEVFYHKKKTKHSYVRVKSPGHIHVTIGRHASKKQMDAHIQAHEDKLLSIIKKYQKHVPYRIFGQEIKQVLREDKHVHYDHENQVLYLPREHSEKALKKFEQSILLETVQDMLDAFPHKDFINIKGLSIRTRYTRTVNGSCHAGRRRINLNLYLVRKPREFLHYVLMHELAHLKVQNHSRDFYQVLEVLCPNYKEIKQAMKND